MKKHRKVFIFALDGMPLVLARKLANEGVMPNLSKLFKRSWWGNLESSFPPLTAPAWVSFATGKNPGNHGIFNFLQPKDDLNDLDIVSSLDIRGKTFYETLEAKGKKGIYINLPCSYPSRIKKGILISSFLAGRDFYYPKDLIKEVPQLAKYKVVPDFVIGLNIEKGLEDISTIEKNRFSCGQKLFQKDWDCFFYLVSGTDWAMHLSFDKLIKGDPDPKVKKIFEKADSYLGWFLDNLPDNAVILIMSDHGFCTNRKIFYINAWLKKKKWLDFKPNWSKTRARSLTEGLIAKAKPKGFKEKTFRKIILFFLHNPFFYSLLVGLFRGTSLVFPSLVPDHLLNMGLEIDPKKTKAYASLGSGGWFGLFINDKKRFKNGIVGSKDYFKLRQKIYQELCEILGKDSVWQKEEIYQGEAIEECPDILYNSKDIFVSSGFSRKIFANKKDNYHSKLGFFMVSNKKIKKGKKIKDLRIIDLAPTILSIFGIKPVAGTEGEALENFS